MEFKLQELNPLLPEITNKTGFYFKIQNIGE